MRTETKILALIAAMLFCLWNVQPVHAVYGGVKITGPTGEKVVGTKVTIFNLEGDKPLGEEDTDPEGILYFEWPKRGGEYLVKWEGGQMTVTAPNFSKTETYTGGAAAAAAALTAGILIANGSSSSGNNSTGSGTQPETGNGTQPETPESMIPSCSDLNGIFVVSGDGITGSPRISCSGNTMAVESATAMKGRYDPQTGQVDVSGSDTMLIESFSGTATRKNGKITISGTLTYKDKKSGESSSYKVTYTKESV